MGKMTSRTRLISAINLEDVDYCPCCFMSFTAMRRRCNEDMYKLTLVEKEMGLDPMLFIPSAPRPERIDHPELRGLPVRFDTAVEMKEWRESSKEGFDILHKEYITPAGKLTTKVQLSGDWPHGDHIPFVDDFQVARSLKPLITKTSDLDALQYMLIPPTEEDIEKFKEESKKALIFAKDNDLLLVGGWGVGMDMANWLCGMQNLMISMMENQDLVYKLIKIIHEWNLKRMEIVLSGGVDLYIRRAWYEGCQFVMPDFFKEYVLPTLKKEADLAHSYNAKFGYICTSGTAPMADYYVDAGIDVLIGVDPVQGVMTDMGELKDRLRDKICLWGGVSGAATVEQGTEEEIRIAVKEAMKILGPTGFVLSPIDNITIDSEKSMNNVKIFIDEWQNSR